MIDQKFRLDGKTVVLVGALGILGSVFTRHLLEAGATVVIADRNGQDCEARALELDSKYKGQVFGLGADITDEESVASFANTLNERNIIPNVLINNAAFKSKDFFKPIDEFPLSDWLQVMQVNVTGIFLMVRAIMPKMIEKGGGTIINTGSIYGVLGPDQRIYDGAHYEDMGGTINTPLVFSASKGAVSGITRHLATSHGAQGIRANTLIPGGVFSGQNDVFVEKYSARIPMERMAQADEIASALIFLASDASSYMNGQDLIIDGGLTAW